MKLETERLLIRPLTIAYKNELLAYRRDKEANKYQGWIPEKIEDVEEFIAKIADRIDVPDTWFQLVLIEKETNTIVGDLGIHFMDSENRQTEIGCTLSKDYQNRGYATEALMRVMDYLFSDLNKHRIIASIDPDNKSSIRLVERVGFRKEAHFIESLWIHGKWVDELIYAMTGKYWDRLK
ncbi:MAG TPA: GNAT family protein [Bacteroidales bacterium]|nr:GNAT family protein [Bacteroidales bacterium]HRZ76455.1 GNAT family protein [Bacteroidales bacterium]